MIQDRFANAIHMVLGTPCLLGTLPHGRFITARTGKLLLQPTRGYGNINLLSVLGSRQYAVLGMEAICANNHHLATPSAQ